MQGGYQNGDKVRSSGFPGRCGSAEDQRQTVRSRTLIWRHRHERSRRQHHHRQNDSPSRCCRPLLPIRSEGTSRGRSLNSCAAGARKLAARGCVVPHAGYMYSGHVAGAVYASLEIPARCILLGPRHFPRGEAMAILSEGSWRTPFGEARIDAELARELMRACPRLREDAVAHEREHSLEVQIPFLQQAREGFSVCAGRAGDRSLSVAGGTGARGGEGGDGADAEHVLVIASSDMNHYESDAVTRAKDERSDCAHPGARSARALRYGARRGNHDVRLCGDDGDAGGDARPRRKERSWCVMRLRAMSPATAKKWWDMQG